MVTMAKTALRCKSEACRKVVMEVTGLYEVEASGIAITRRCKCGTWNEWKVRPEPEPRVQRYCKTT